MNEYQVKLGNKANAIVNKYEPVILIVIFIFIGLQLFLEIPLLNQLFIMILGTIATAYFFAAFAVPENQEIKAIDLFFNKLVGWASSIAIIGIIFTLLKWPNSTIMTIVGLSLLFIGLLYIVFKKYKNPDKVIFGKFIIIRIVFLILASAGLLFYHEMI